MGNSKQLLAASLGALISLAGGFVQLPACGRIAGPLAKKTCSTGPSILGPRSYTLQGSHVTHLRRRNQLQATPEDLADAQRPLARPPLAVDAPGEGAGLSVAATPEEDSVAPKKRWKIFSREHDTEIASMAIPSYTAVLLDPIATLIDVTFIGRLPESTLSLAGVGISNTILNYFSFLFFFMVVTTTTTVAQALAKTSSTLSNASMQSDEDRGNVTRAGQAEGSRIIAGSILCSLVMGIASASLSWIFAPQLVALIGSSRSADAASFAIAYMRNKCLGIPAMLVFFSVIGAFRGYRDLKTPLIGNVFSAIAKVAFGYVFLFQLGLGVGGAGLADALARYLSLSVLISLLVRSGRLRLRDLLEVPSSNLVAELVTPGGALTVRKFVEQICFTVTMRFSASFGATALASAEIARQCWSMLSILWWPLAVAGQTLVASALAEYTATRKAAKLVLARGIAIRVMFISTLLGTSGALVLVLARDVIPSLMTSNPAVQALAASQLPFLALIMPVTALCDVVESCFIAAKDYGVVLRAMVFGAVALTLAIGACTLLKIGIRTQWLAILALYSARLLLALRRFNSAKSSIPREANHPIEPSTLRVSE
mmetsp:Transcript_15582/g.36322  ORF Transcript_15582/g.36322 Transcript_15582/m.36322 type:complete len:599 (+) Transcript_15582:20-1816(+)